MPGTKRVSAGAVKEDTQKKPTSGGYQMFRDERKKENNRELVRNIIHQWESMDEDKKQHYEELAQNAGVEGVTSSTGKKTRQTTKAAKSSADVEDGGDAMKEEIPAKGDPRTESTESGKTEGEASIQPEELEVGFIEKDVMAEHRHAGEASVLPEQIEVGFIEKDVMAEHRHAEPKTDKAEPPVVEKTFSEKKTRATRSGKSAQTA